jgi:hypothetical protein
MSDQAYGNQPQQTVERKTGAGAPWCWWYQTATGRDAEIWCYSDRISYVAGDEISLHVSTTAERYDIEIYRDGARRQVVFAQQSLEGASHPAPDNCSELGCGWPVALRVRVDSAWASGGYIAVLRGVAQGKSVRYEHWFAIRPARNDPDALLLVATTATWVAYNAWGGSNSYEGIWGPERNRLAPLLSLERPWGHGIAWLPEGAPRLANGNDVPLGWVPRYEALEWAFANAYPKYCGTHGWAMYESLFVRWAESQSYQVNVVTQHDLHADPTILDGARCVVLVGHDEYWSWEMRDTLDAYVEGGGHVARFAGNFWWQVRLERDGRQQRCHKHFARAEDPVMLDGTGDTQGAKTTRRAQRSRITSAWDDPLTGRPSVTTMGVSGPRGVYAKFGGFNARGSGGFTVYRQKHWSLAGADLYYGDVVGATSNVFAFEVDGLDYVIRNGLPFATGEDGSDPEAVEIIALSPACLIEEDHGNEGTSLFVGQFDCEYVAEIVFGDTKPETVDRASRGCGAMLTYRKGAGEVFNAPSVEWVMGLKLRDPFVERITRNVLSHYLE